MRSRGCAGEIRGGRFVGSLVCARAAESSHEMRGERWQWQWHRLLFHWHRDQVSAKQHLSRLRSQQKTVAAVVLHSSIVCERDRQRGLGAVCVREGDVELKTYLLAIEPRPFAQAVGGIDILKGHFASKDLHGRGRQCSCGKGGCDQNKETVHCCCCRLCLENEE